MTAQITVYLVDDDIDVNKTLARALKYNGYSVQTFSSGQAFLQSVDIRNYGCIILDVAMPEMSGIEVQNELSSQGNSMPIIFMTGHGDVPTSVRAIKGGAMEFLEKPFPMDQLFELLEEALVMEEQRKISDQENQDIVERFDTLTDRETDVMASLVKGRADKSNKEVARELDLSPRTVEEYRARIMHKMNASSITHLVEIAKLCGVYRN